MRFLNALHLNVSWRNAWPQRSLTWLVSLTAMRRAVATRRQLAELDDRALKDIGISRADALAEAGRAPWDLETRRTGWRD